MARWRQELCAASRLRASAAPGARSAAASRIARQKPSGVDATRTAAWGLTGEPRSPGAVATELPDSITEADVSSSMHEFYEEYAVPADSFARVVAFAISQPEDVDINEVLYRPTLQLL